MLTRQNVLFSKIANSGGEWTFDYLHQGVKPVKMSLSSKEVPPRDLIDALAACGDVLLEVMQLNLEGHRYVTTGIGFSEDKNQVIWVQGFLEVGVRDSYFVLKTPKVPYSATEKTIMWLTQDQIEYFEALQDSAIEFLEGKRAQTEMF